MKNNACFVITRFNFQGLQIQGLMQGDVTQSLVSILICNVTLLH